MNDSQEFIDKLAWIYIKDGKVLSTLSRGKDTYYIPGGKREVGESDEVALSREIKEELTVGLIPGTIKKFGVFTAQAHGKMEGMKVRMTCYTAKFEGELKPAAEIEKIVWLGYTGRERSSPVDKLIFDYLKEKKLIL